MKISVSQRREEESRSGIQELTVPSNHHQTLIAFWDHLL